MKRRRLFALASISLVLSVSALVLWPMSVCSTGTSSANVMRCQQNLRQLGRGLMLYAHDHNGVYPAELKDLLASADAEEGNLLCPFSADKAAYLYVGGAMFATAGPTTVIVIEPIQNHRDGANALYLDGTVKFLGSNDVQKILTAARSSHINTSVPK